MRNLQRELEEIIHKLDYKPRLMLHACCAPCASYCIEYLKDYFTVVVVYYNPNIAPYEEYKTRLDETKRLCDYFGVEFISKNWDNEIFENKVEKLREEKEGGARCDVCFGLRLKKTLELAKEHHCEYFTTSLSISPMKNSLKLIEIGERIAQNTEINYLPSDFKKKNGYKRSVELAKELNLYRQNYCGCVYSNR